MSVSEMPKEPIENLVERDLSGWAQFIWNCTDGSNYFRYSEYCDLIRCLDGYASDLAAAIAERDALRAENERLREDAERWRAVWEYDLCLHRWKDVWWVTRTDFLGIEHRYDDSPTREAAIDAARTAIAAKETK